jgi:DNA-binding GntR family transcriptional regulator
MINSLNLPVNGTLRITDSVYLTLRTAIIRHDLAPGFHLSVPALAEQLGVSRSPIREAVQKLVSEGLATEEPRRGAHVTKHDSPELRSLFQVRSVLDGVAARLVAKQHGDELISKLDGLMSAHLEAVEANDPERFIALDIQFHLTILRACENNVVKDMLSQIYDRINRPVEAPPIIIGPEKSRRDHRAILDAIIAGDAQRAEEAARGHVDHLIDWLEQSITAPPDSSSQDGDILRKAGN